MQPEQGDRRTIETMPTVEPISWRETKRRLRADRKRLELILQGLHSTSLAALLHPSFICVVLYRLSNHFSRAGRRYLARIFWHLNILLTGADIGEAADLAEGLVIVSPPGTSVMGKAGKNFTVMPCAGLGGEIGRTEDVGAGPGLPVIGDDVVLEPHCGVLGPVRIGHRVRIAAPVTQDVPDDMIVERPQPRFVRRRDVP